VTHVLSTLFRQPKGARQSANNGDSSDSDFCEIDLDLSVDIMALGGDGTAEINAVAAKNYCVGKGDFVKYLGRDVAEHEELKALRAEEEAKAMLTGRKGRRERRLIRERKLMARRGISPPR